MALFFFFCGEIMQQAILKTISPDLEIQPLDRSLLTQAQKHLDRLTKPKGSLGRLEEIAMRLYAIFGGRTPLCVAPAIMYTVAADHGVAKQNVSAYPQIVTRQMVENFLSGGGAINSLCQANGITLSLIDAGCKGGPFAEHPALITKRFGEGTHDFTEQAAMNRETAVQALQAGISLAREAALMGCQCLATGEMGIGNTTSATAIFAALFNCDVAAITGPGTGITPQQLQHKKEVISQALNLHHATLAQGDTIDLLACLGGFEIAVMSGIMLGAAAEELPFLVDGFISTAAYVCARAIDPAVEGYAFLTHVSAEPGFQCVLEKLQARPLLDLGMRLGEGTGAAMAYPILRSAAALYNKMATLTHVRE